MKLSPYHAAALFDLLGELGQLVANQRRTKQAVAPEHFNLKGYRKLVAQRNALRACVKEAA